MPIQKLIDELDAKNVKYVVIRHSRAYTAQEIAASAHVPGRELAKTVMVKLDGKPAMVVVRAVDQVDLDRVREAAGASDVALAVEGDFAALFPGVEVGAMPPFGHLYGMPVYADERLREDREIAFNAGSHTELVRLAYADFERVAKPVVGAFARARAAA